MTHILDFPFHLIGDQTPYQPSIPPTSTQHDNSISHLKSYITKEYESTLISIAENTIPNVNKWLSHTVIHLRWSNLLWMPPRLHTHKSHKYKISATTNTSVTTEGNTSSNKTYPQHITYAFSNKMTHASTYHHAPKANT